MLERHLVSTLNRSLEMMRDLSRQDEDGGGLDDNVMTLTSRLGY